ncbi:MAG TPA: TetR/AcrR family transcriptional regulator [Microbacterium sp.]|nr:TetR/AcrR family transcriptional regulator [Microbacterium sp.]
MSTAPPRATLDRDRVVEAAIGYADAHGLDATTMRRLGEALGVTPMALYKHVASREGLIDAMVDRLVAAIDDPEVADAPDDADAPDAAAPEHAAPEHAPADWRAVVRGRILAAREALRTHPWAQDAIESRTEASPVVLAYLDSLMRAMFDGGLSADLVHHGMHALSTRMWGFTRDVMPMPTAPADPAARAAAIGAFFTAYPSIGRMSTTAPHAGDGCDDDAEFAFALDLLLEGLAARHASGWTSAP